MFGGAGPVVATDDLISLPKGAALDLDLGLGGAARRADRIEALMNGAPSTSRRLSRRAGCALPASLKGRARFYEYRWRELSAKSTGASTEAPCAAASSRLLPLVAPFV